MTGVRAVARRSLPARTLCCAWRFRQEIWYIRNYSEPEFELSMTQQYYCMNSEFNLLVRTACSRSWRSHSTRISLTRANRSSIENGFVMYCRAPAWIARILSAAVSLAVRKSSAALAQPGTIRRR